MDLSPPSYSAPAYFSGLGRKNVTKTQSKELGSRTNCLKKNLILKTKICNALVTLPAKRDIYKEGSWTNKSLLTFFQVGKVEEQGGGQSITERR